MLIPEMAERDWVIDYLSDDIPELLQNWIESRDEISWMLLF